MISHAITVFKAPVQPAWVAPVHRPETGLSSQEELDKAIAECPFVVGDFLTLAPGPVTSLTMVHRIIAIEADFKKIILSGYHKKPNLMRVLQCNMHVQTPWLRWDSPPGYRRLSQEEFDTFIVPNRDQLQDYCSKYT